MTVIASYEDPADAGWIQAGTAAKAESADNAVPELTPAVAQERAMSVLLQALPSLKRFGTALTGSVADADDLVQIAVERALQKPGLLSSVTSLNSWMRCIMRNSWLDNRKSARQRYEAPTDSYGDVAGEDGEQAVLHRSQLRATQKAMDALSPELRDALVLVTIDGLSYREAADRLGIPVACLNSRIARARASLAEQIGLLRTDGKKR